MKKERITKGQNVWLNNEKYTIKKVHDEGAGNIDGVVLVDSEYRSNVKTAYKRVPQQAESKFIYETGRLEMG